jgi:hypothetical protein
VWLGCNEEPCLVLNRFAIAEVIHLEELADLASVGWLHRTHIRKIPENFFARGRRSQPKRG